MQKFEFRVSPEPLVSCAQASPAKGHDGLWVTRMDVTERLAHSFPDFARTTGQESLGTRDDTPK